MCCERRRRKYQIYFRRHIGGVHRAKKVDQPHMSNKKKGAPMPASSAGLLRFFEDETEGVKIRPQFVLAASMALIVGSIVINQLFR
jgi:preprotein translocase subunit Sec61beta